MKITASYLAKHFKWFALLAIVVGILDIAYPPFLEIYKYGGARNALATAQRDPNDVKAHEMAAIALYSDRDFAGAAEQYAAWMKIEPRNERPIRSYALCLERAGKKQEALPVYRRLSQMSGSSGQIGRFGVQRLTGKSKS